MSDADWTIHEEDVGAEEPKKTNSGSQTHPPRKPAPAVTAEALNKMRFEPLKHIVPPYVVEGCTLIAGNPKMGKSWWCLQAGTAVAEGKPAFEGADPCEQGDVLYMALEDNERRMQRRLTKMLGTRPWPARLTFRFESPPAHLGGLDLIREWAASVEKPRLVMIDIFGKFRRPRGSRDDPYQADLRAVQEIQELATELKLAIILIHHNRKGAAEVDAFEVVSGTMGLTGGVDTVLVLKRDGTGVTLTGRGRDLAEDVSVAVSFDPATARWRIIGDAELNRQSEERREILAVLGDAADPLGPQDIAHAISKTNQAVRFHLSKMVRSDPPAVRKVARGRYTLADKDLLQ